MTMMVWASADAPDAAIPAFCSKAENSAAILLPEKIPVKIPISVMPTCTAERNLSGSWASFKAVLAALLPLLASAWRLDFLAEMMAISDMAKTPFKRISKSIIKISSIKYFNVS